MARFAYIITKGKDGSILKKIKENVASLENEVIPFIIKSNTSKIIEGEKSLCIIFNSVDTESIKGENLCLGLMMPETEDWYKVGAKEPDGNYSIVRMNDDIVEVLTDYQATSTIWYYLDDNMFIVSSSQRVIISIIGDFQIDNNTVSWMISSGTLGPENSWDKRIKGIKPASIILLNRNTWELKYITKEIRFDIEQKRLEYYNKKYFSVVNDVIRSMPVNIKYVQPLTGGYDSRLILFSFLENGKKANKYITFGLKESESIKYSDADIAHKLARKYSLNWKYFHTNYKSERPEDFFDLFLSLGEGRLDNVERFSDGFNMWQNLFEQKYQVVIIGSEGFRSQNYYKNEKFILLQKRLILIKDIKNVPKIFHKKFYQIFPNSLKKRESESIGQYYHRIAQEFFGPYADAALNYPKTAFLEVVCPLESKTILDLMRKIPDKYREDKKIIKQYVKGKDKNIPFNTKLSVEKTGSFLKNEKVLNCIINFVEEEKNKQKIISIEFIDYVLANVILKSDMAIDPYSGKKITFANRIKSTIPKNIMILLVHIKRKINARKGHKVTIDMKILLFRIYISLKINKMFLSDSKTLQ